MQGGQNTKGDSYRLKEVVIVADRGVVGLHLLNPLFMVVRRLERYCITSIYLSAMEPVDDEHVKVG